MPEKRTTFLPLAAELARRGFPYEIALGPKTDRHIFIFHGDGLDEAVQDFFSDTQLQEFLAAFRVVRERLNLYKSGGAQK